MQTAAISSFILRNKVRKNNEHIFINNFSILYHSIYDIVFFRFLQTITKACIYTIWLSYHKELSFVDSFISISVEHVEGDLETSFRLYNEIDHRGKFIALYGDAQYQQSHFVTRDIYIKYYLKFFSVNEKKKQVYVWIPIQNIRNNLHCIFILFINLKIFETILMHQNVKL